MAIYTSRFVAEYVPDVASARVWTVPGDANYVVRDVVLGNESAVQRQSFLVLKVLSGSSMYLVAAPTLPGYSTTHVELRQELLAGEELWWYSNSGGPLSLLVTGYRLSS